MAIEWDHLGEMPHIKDESFVGKKNVYRVVTNMGTGEVKIKIYKLMTRRV